MVSVKWTSTITGNIDSSSAALDPRVNTTTFGEIAYSQSIVNNTSGEDQTISFKNASGVEAFTLTFPDGEHNLFWKTDASGTPLWGFVVSNSTVYTTIIDSDGNLYFSLVSVNPVLFFNSSGALAQTVNLQMGMTNQNLIVKYNSSGVFQWVIRMGSTQTLTIPRIKLDSDNHLYAIGDYNANVTILDTDSTSTIITGGSNSDMLVASFNEAGEILWSAKMTGSDTEGVSAIEIYEDHLYISGAYKSDPLVLTPGTGSVKNFVGGVGPLGPVGYGITISLNKNTGAYLWAVVFDAPADLRMITSQSNSTGAYIIGTIPSENVEIKDGNNEVIGEIVSGEDANLGIFIVKVNHDGEYLWHTKVEANGSDILMSEDAFSGSYHSGSILDSAGNVYLKAHYYGESETPGVPRVFDKEDTLIGTLQDSVSELDRLNVLILQIKSDGSFGWITKLKPDSEKEVFCFEMFVGADDNLYLTGGVAQSNLRLYNAGGSTPVRTITTLVTDFFNTIVFSYSNNGKYRWITHIQYPDFEMEPFSSLIKQADTRLKRMNILFNIINSRLGLTSNRVVYLNLVAFPGLNEFFIENKKVLTLEFDAPHPYLLALDGSTAISSPNNMLLIVLAIALIALAGIMIFRG
jgi:hypothetical protein